MFYFLLCFLLTSRTTFGDDDPCKDASIDGMSRIKYEATNEIYIYSGEYYYKFDVEDKVLDIEGRTKIKDTWPEVEPPITGTAIFLPNSEDNYMVFAKGRKMWLYPLTPKGKAGGKNIADLKKGGPLIRETSQYVEAMRWNSKPKYPGFNVRICYNNQPNDCTLDLKDSYILPECRELDRKHEVKNCRAVTSALYKGEEILLIASPYDLHYYTKDDTPKNKQALNIKEDVFGCKSMLLIVFLFVLAVGVAFLLLSLIPLIIVLIIRRRKVKVHGSNFNEDTSVASRTGVQSKPSLAESMVAKKPKAITNKIPLKQITRSFKS